MILPIKPPLPTSSANIAFRLTGIVPRRLIVLLIGTLGACLAQAGTHAATTAPEAGLVGYWNFDESSGTSVFDGSGSNNLGTISGNGASRVSGKVGPGALNFDGVSGKVTIPHSSSLNLTSSFTLAAWVRPAAFNSYQTALVKGSTAACTYWLQTSSTRFSSGFATSSNCSQYREHLVSGTNLQANTWYHVAAVFDNAANTFTYYVNGTAVYSASETTAPVATTEALVIGQSAYAGGNFERWIGQVDEVRVYNRALGAQEVVDVFTDTGSDSEGDGEAPSRPTGVSATGVSSTEIDLSWNASSDNVGVVGYRVYRNGVVVGSTTSLTFSDENLNANTSYSYTVAAYDYTQNLSDQSSTVTATTFATTSDPDRSAPSIQITAPTANAVLEGSVNVGASASDDVGVAAVQFLLDGAAIGPEDTSAPFSFTWNTAQTSDGSHQVAARARDVAGNVAVSVSVPVRVDNLPPAGTIAINGGGNYTSSRTVTLNLTATDGAGTVTEMRFANGSTYSSPESFRTTKTWTLSWGEGVKTVSVQYRDSAGHWSQGFNDSITYDVTAPTISSITSAGVSSSGATVTWATNEGATSRVEYGLTTSYGQTSHLSATLVTSHSIALSGLQTNTTYNYRVRSIDGAGNERVSSNATFRTTNTPDTSAPNVSIGQPADNTTVAGLVTISATASDNRGVAGVLFLLDNVALSAEDTSAPYELTWDTAGVSPGTHTLLARARDAAGNTGTSTPVTVIVDSLSDNQPPSRPTNLSATAVSSSQIDLSWGVSTDDVGPVSYQVLRGGNQIATSTTTTYSDVGLVASSTYTYTVRAIDGGGNLSAQSASASATTQPPGGSDSYAFPLRLSSDRKSLVDQGSRPFFINGDTAWSLIVNTTNSEAIQYLQNRADKGYNAIIVNLIDTVFSERGPNNLAGDPPFTTPNNFATPGAAYWSHVDWVLNEAAARGIVVFAHPLYLGYQCGVEGWCQAARNASTTTMRAYGEFLGQRYRNQPNIVWVIGGDANPVAQGVESKVMALVNGIRAHDTVHVMTAHNIQESAINPNWANDSWIDLNTVYTYAESHQATLMEYNRDPRPIFFQETSYERDGTPEAQIRRQAWWSVLSGARLGHFFGNCPLWGFGDVRSYCTAPSGGWQGQLNSPLSIQMAYVGKLFMSRAFHLLVPDQQGSVMTAGVQSGSSKATTSRAQDGSSVIAYIPTRRQVTIDMSKIAGTQARGWWFNPTTAQATLIGDFATSGSRSFTPPSTSDWVLVLDNLALNLGAPGE